MGQPNAMMNVDMWGGYECCFLCHWELAAPLDKDERQTNNRAEFKAAIAAVLKATQRTAMFGDSKYVLDGIEEEAPPRTQGLHSTSALMWAPQRAWLRKPLLIFSPLMGTLDNAGVM